MYNAAYISTITTNAAVTNYTCYKTIWWQSQTLEWVYPHKHQHGTILYTYYTVSSYFQLALERVVGKVWLE